MSIAKYVPKYLWAFAPQPLPKFHHLGLAAQASARDALNSTVDKLDARRRRPDFLSHDRTVCAMLAPCRRAE